MLGIYNITILMKLMITFDVPGRCSADMALTPRANDGSSAKNVKTLTTVTNVGLNDSAKRSTLSPRLCPSVIDSAPFLLRVFSIGITSRGNGVGAALCRCLSGCRQTP